MAQCLVASLLPNRHTHTRHAFPAAREPDVCPVIYSICQRAASDPLQSTKAQAGTAGMNPLMLCGQQPGLSPFRRPAHASVVASSPPPYQSPHTSTLPFLPSHAVALHSPTIQAGAMTRYSKFEVELPAGHGQVGQKLLERDVSIAVMCVRNRHCLPRCLAGPPQEYNACLASRSLLTTLRCCAPNTIVATASCTCCWSRISQRALLAPPPRCHFVFCLSKDLASATGPTGPRIQGTHLTRVTQGRHNQAAYTGS